MLGSKSLVTLASLMLAAMVTFLYPTTSQAADVRRGDRIEIGAEETIDDNLIVTGKTVIIEGHITGDTVVFANSVTVNGTIDGNLVTVAKDVDIEGIVRGSVLSAGRHVHVVGLYGSQLYAAGRVVTLDTVDLSGDAMLAGSKIGVSGSIGRDVYATGDHVTVDAVLQRDLIVDSDDVHVGKYAWIGRNLTADVRNSNDLVVEAGASVNGLTNVDLDTIEDTRFDDFSFYAGKILTLAAGLLFGVVAFVFAPNMFKAPREQTEQHRWLRVFGLGIAALIVIPVIAVIIAVTLVGIPVAMVAIGGYALALYLGKLFIVAELGRRLLNLSGQKRSDVAWSLLVGLLIVGVLVELPYVGGILSFALAVLGLGTVINYMLGRRRRRVASQAVVAT
jgi:cytoskeletal protein CcmA (bactofilin family)